MYRGEIKRCRNFDGSKIETVVSSPLPEFKPCAIVVDGAKGMIYWTDYVVDHAQSATLDGDDVQYIYSAGGNTRTPTASRWTSRPRRSTGASPSAWTTTSADIKRMNPDGSKVETVVPGVGLVVDLVLVPEGQHECYADFDGNGTLDLFDFLAYVNTFNGGGDDADCDGNQSLDLFDFLCFVNAFNAGC